MYFDFITRKYRQYVLISFDIDFLIPIHIRANTAIVLSVRLSFVEEYGFQQKQ